MKKKTATHPLEEGQAPAFTLPDSNGKKVSLASLKGKIVVLYFYPRDNTPGCTVEACAFRDAQPSLEQLGAVVLGISPDTPDSHVRFSEKYSLNFTLLADPDHAVAEKYGAWVEKNMYGKKCMGIQRSTFLIDGAGIVRRVWRKVKPEGHAGEVLESVRQLPA